MLYITGLIEEFPIREKLVNVVLGSALGYHKAGNKCPANERC